MTVHPDRTSHYLEKFAFLGYALKVMVFDRASGCSQLSDHNPDIRREIYENTKTCIKVGMDLGNDYVMVLQEDVVLTDNRQMSESTASALTFMYSNPAADMFMFGTHPFSFHMGTSVVGIVRFLYAFHWQAVLFRVSSLAKFIELPCNMHSDLYFARMMLKRKIFCYGLLVPVARQDSSGRLIRKYEYDLFYKSRSKFPCGDPLPLIVIAVFLLFGCSWYYHIW
jgi:hypothetical protein